MVGYCGTVKTSHKGFFLAILEQLLNDWPIGSYISLYSMPIFDGYTPLIYIEYTYNSWNFLGFISYDMSGSSDPGDPCLSHFPVMFSNVYIWHDVRYYILGRSFNYFN